MRVVLPRPHAGVMTLTEMPSTPSAAAPLTVVAALYEAFGRGDQEALLALVDPDVDWSLQVDAPGAELVAMLVNGRGHDAVRHYFSGVAALEFHVFEPRAFHLDGDVVLVELALDVSHRETGKRAQLTEIHRFVVREGRVVHYRPFVDTATLIDLYRS